MKQTLTLFTFIATILFFSCKNSTKIDNNAVATPKVTYDLFVGTYTQKEGHVDGKGEGIYRIKLDSNLNEMSRTVIGGVTNPSWIEVGEKVLLCVEETMPDGKVTSFTIDGDKITKVNSQSTLGGAPCHLAAQENMVVVANYMGGNVVSYFLDEKKMLSEPKDNVKFYGKGKTPRQEASHPHYVDFYTGGKHPELAVVDLGTDTIYCFTYAKEGDFINNHSESYNKDGKLTRAGALFASNKGNGPRHALLGGYITYSLNELSSTIDICADFGQRKWQTISTLPDKYKGKNLTAEIHGTQNFIYASNRGHNSIAIFKKNEDLENQGKLENIGFESTRGDFPRSFNITPDGKYLFCANQNTDNIVIFEIQIDGKLKFVKELNVKTPVCVQFRP